MPGGAGPVRLAACAKLNLYLHVAGRLADGYHLLDSLVVFADLADRLDLEPADGLSIAVEGPFARDAGPDLDNLVLRAASALAQRAGTAAGARIRLVKNIPAAAGLGGGSADAAATLEGLARLWKIDRRRIDLASIAITLGADVPVCLLGKPAFVGGIGERLDPAPPLPEAGLLLVNPRVQLATARVFAQRRGGFSPPGRFAGALESVAALAEILADRTNDLTESAVSLAPVVADVLAAIERLPGCRLARMTGSGATCFGLFDDPPAAAEAAPALAGRNGWWVHAGRTLAGPCR